MKPINTELAHSVRRVNSEFFALDVSDRPELSTRDWRQLEEAIDAATDADDREAALKAIKRWERNSRRVIRGRPG